MQITHLAWSDATQELTHTGAANAAADEAGLVKVVGAR
jgi:hypothetical protein